MASNPCGICRLQVFDSDDAIQCDGNCGLWHHRECLGMTIDFYLSLGRECDDWVCKKCVVVEQEMRKKRNQARSYLRSKRELNMRKSTKPECVKLEFLTDSQKCLFCNTSDRDEMKYGSIYTYKTIITHYYCLLLSSNMEQNGRDSDGILGFLPADITKEAKRGSKLYCSYCRTNGATLGCAIARCKTVFHLPCGLKNGTLHQFFGEFKSYCAKHRPIQQVSEKILAESSSGAMCGICYEKVVPRPVHETLWAPCCQKSAFFHRECVQKLATSAGYFFKCPLCNNVETFQKAMKEFGIFIPEQDASWERVPQAYQDLLVRHDTCDSVSCKCPSGRKTNVSGTRWELILCKFCGSQGVHIGCGRLKWRCPEFECAICTDTSETPEANRSLTGDRHRLSGGRLTADIPPSVSANRERDISSSSSDEGSDASETNHERLRIPSPLLQHRYTSVGGRTPSQTHLKQTNHNRNEATFSVKTDVFNQMSKSIVIDDSDDSEVEIVDETNSCCLKTKDGSTIKVIALDNVQKRLMVEGDVKVMPEIVDITNHKRQGQKRPRMPSPIPDKEVIFSFPSPKPVVPQPSLSAAYNTPSASFVLIDPTTLRQEDLPPNAVIYRSVQPMVSLPQAPVHPPAPVQSQQIPVQSQPISVQSQQMPTQQLGSQRHADAKHSDLGKHWRGSCHYLCPFHLQNGAKKKSARALKHYIGGRRRRGRDSECYYNRLNPTVLLSPLKSRVRDDHFEVGMTNVVTLLLLLLLLLLICAIILSIGNYLCIKL